MFLSSAVSDRSLLQLTSDTHNPASCPIFDNQQDYDQDYSEAKSLEDELQSFILMIDCVTTDKHGVTANCLAQYNN